MKLIFVIFILSLSISSFAQEGRRGEDRRGRERRSGEHRDGGNIGDAIVSLEVSNTLINFLALTSINQQAQKANIVKLLNDSNAFFQSGEMSIFLASAVSSLQANNLELSDSEAVTTIIEFAQSK